MSVNKRLALLAGLAAGAFVLGACGSSDPGADGGTDAGTCDPRTEECECIEDEQCPGDGLFFCNTSTFTCQPACRTKADCTAAVRGDFALSYCEGNLGCVCDEGTCVASLCSADVDCGANNACRNGSCVAFPSAASATRCQISPDYAMVKEGHKAQFWVSFWAGNEPLVLKDGMTWSAATDRVSAPMAQGNTAEFTGLTAGDANQAVKVTAGSAECFATVRTLSATVTSTDVRVTVVNELTGRPIEGATVLLSHPTTGAAIGSAAQTAANGSVSIDFGGAANVTATAFHNDFSYVSVVNVPTGTGSSRDLLIATRRNQVDKYGGYKGTFTNVPTTPNVHAGIAGMSIPGAVTDLSVTQLLGHTVPTDVKIGSAIDQKGVPLPAGVYLHFSEQGIKEQVSAQGVAGVCTDAQGNPKEAAIKAGECGTRTAWALAGDVPLGDLPIDAVTGGLDNIDFGKVLSRVVPIFRRFSSSVRRDVEFTLVPVANPEDPNFSDTSHFTPGVNHEFGQMPLGFNFAVKVPDLPQFRNSFADGVLLLGGADVKGRGVVPLGLGAGVNTAEPKDAKVDEQSPLKAGQIQMRMAPTHHGLEGSQYGITALAVSLQSVNDASAGLAVSAIYHRLAENRLVFDPKGETPVELAGSFINYPEGAKYNFTGSAQSGLAGRTFRFVGGKDLSAASVVRVQFTNVADRRWVAIADPATAAAGFALPTPPGTLADRTFYIGNTAGERSKLLVQALQLRSGGNAISHANLVELNGTNADRFSDFMTGFSAIDYGRPDITWVAPVNGATIPPGTAVRLDVSSFKVGTGTDADGVVKITFGGGASAGCTEQTINQDASGGAGELSHTLPSSCTGSNVQMTATLHNTQGPIAPGVSRTITVNIQ
jgi:hypothetical protein